jgi:hypothetical protein
MWIVTLLLHRIFITAVSCAADATVQTDSSVYIGSSQFIAEYRMSEEVLCCCPDRLTAVGHNAGKPPTPNKRTELTELQKYRDTRPKALSLWTTAAACAAARPLERPSHRWQSLRQCMRMKSSKAPPPRSH